MALSPGTRLGPYEVSGLIGSGGMGEVYRATDTNLKRQVALKVLPASLAGDAERLARFQREAEVLAALNHPHIAQIYGLEKSASGTALVIELVDGEDLSQRIMRGPMPLDEALPIAKQIAEALEAAHEQGIIHRDLKPANIKLKGASGPTPTRSPDGSRSPTLATADVAGCTVKVLDFGLAKAVEPTGATADLANSPTLTSPAMTQAGVILGTAAYMSPEQARGKPVDKRTDIWAFGCVLYQMLTATPAFADEDVSLTLSRVLRAEPDVSKLPRYVPPRIHQTLAMCLRKDPNERMADIRDVDMAVTCQVSKVVLSPLSWASNG